MYDVLDSRLITTLAMLHKKTTATANKPNPGSPLKDRSRAFMYVAGGPTFAKVATSPDDTIEQSTWNEFLNRPGLALPASAAKRTRHAQGPKLVHLCYSCPITRYLNMVPKAVKDTMPYSEDDCDSSLSDAGLHAHSNTSSPAVIKIPQMTINDVNDDAQDEDTRALNHLVLYRILT